MILLDTNVVSELMKPQPNATMLARLDAAEDSAAIASLTVAEIFQGLLVLPLGKRRNALLDAAEQILAPLRVVSFGYDEALAYATIVAERRSQGRPISPFDAQIAACARVHDVDLYTRNVADFAGLGLSTINPFDPS